jgi:hypothetical protein
MSTPRKPAKPKPIQVDVQRWRCPVCSSVRLRAYRTTDLGDGSQVRYSRCRDCGQRLILNVDFGIIPTVGKPSSEICYDSRDNLLTLGRRTGATHDSSKDKEHDE